MPSAEAMTRSSGVVMNPRTRSALAPMYAVVTVMAAFSLRGYWRTLSERIACTPAITMMRLTTMARTGRRMKRSVNFILCSAVDGVGGQFGGRREIVAHRHGAAVAQLEGAARHDGFAGGEARSDRYQIAPALSEPHELLLGDEPGRLAGLRRRLFQREHRIAIGRVEDGGGRNHQHRTLLRREYLDVCEHAREQAAVGIGEDGADADVARAHVHLGIDDADGPLPALLREHIGAQPRPHAR